MDRRRSRSRRLSRLQCCRGIAVVFGLLIVAPLTRAAQLEPLNLSYSAAVVSGAPFWIGQELKLFEREGLRSQLVYINAGPRVMAAILAGEVQHRHEQQGNRCD